MSKQQVSQIPLPLNVVTEVIISRAPRDNAGCAQRDVVALCTHNDRFKMDEIFRNIKCLEK